RGGKIDHRGSRGGSCRTCLDSHDSSALDRDVLIELPPACLDVQEATCVNDDSYGRGRRWLCDHRSRQSGDERKRRGRDYFERGFHVCPHTSAAVGGAAAVTSFPAIHRSVASATRRPSAVAAAQSASLGNSSTGDHGWEVAITPTHPPSRL